MTTPELSAFPVAREEPDNLLDMMSADMDFEQAFSMYSTMQQKNAVSGVEQLLKVQKLNDQFVSLLNSPPQEAASFSGLLTQVAPLADSDSHHNFTFEPPSLDKFDFTDKVFTDATPQGDFDQFFSHTESDALERFLDNLANPTANPLLIYNSGPSGTPQPMADLNVLYDLHTMKTTQPGAHKHQGYQQDVTVATHRHHSNPLPQYSDSVKQELSGVLYHSRELGGNSQLPTPMDSRQLSSTLFQKTPPKRTFDYGDDLLSTSPPASPVRRGSVKKQKKVQRPLLSLEQKRLNHSHSEQKRRQLCKTAYERCLRLVTNIHDYSKGDESHSKKKLKRRQVTKDGLPNLSKHTALMKISGEICKLKQKNEKIKQLLGV